MKAFHRCKKYTENQARDVFREFAWVLAGTLQQTRQPQGQVALAKRPKRPKRATSSLARAKSAPVHPC